MSQPSASKNNQQTIRIQKWITITGVVLLVAKFIAFYVTQSVAILTDALESIVNVVAGFISLYSLYVAAQPRDEEHPYGHGKAEFLSAGVEGTLIFLAGIFIIFEAIKKLIYPQEIQQLDTGIILVAACGVVNLIAGFIATKTGKKNNSLAITATGKHLLSDAISTAGLIVGLMILYFTHLKWVDSVIAILFAIIIIYTGVQILRSSIAGMMDEADKNLLHQMVEVLNRHRRANWIDLHNLRVIKYGSELHLDCHLTMPWYLNLDEAHQEVDELATLVRKEFGDSLELFVHEDGCRPFSCPICSVENCPVRKHAFEKQLEWTTENIFQDKKHSLTYAE